MELIYKNKQSEEYILTKKISSNLQIHNTNKNLLLEGENFEIMRILLDKYSFQNKIDLIYIDPPFSTNNTFFISEEKTSTISSSKTDKIAYTDTLKGDDFLEFLRSRLILARELLSKNGSIYLHIDYKIGHYVKIIMDEIFGSENFRNDITRIKCNPKNFNRKAYGNIKDLILFYTKSSNYIWNEPMLPYTEKDIKNLYKKKDINGRAYTTIPLHAPGETKDGLTGTAFKGIMPPKGRHWRVEPSKLEELDKQGLIEWSINGVPRKKIYADEQYGKKMQDIWEFKDNQSILYPTEKNYDLLKNIINASSNKNSLVLDFFCGSGTTLCAANELERKWIGIDQSSRAIEVVKKKMSKISNDLFVDVDFEFTKLDDKQEIIA